MGRLTTHVLDTARGRPAAGLLVEVWSLDGDRRRLLGSATTNADGRLDRPALDGEAFRPGLYELVFHAGAYLRAGEVPLAEPAFLDTVPVRFRIADAKAHYHVPLLLSPFGYSTYRGS